jgi:hypothetical protein
MVSGYTIYLTTMAGCIKETLRLILFAQQTTSWTMAAAALSNATITGLHMSPTHYRVHELVKFSSVRIEFIDIRLDCVCALHTQSNYTLLTNYIPESKHYICGADQHCIFIKCNTIIALMCAIQQDQIVRPVVLRSCDRFE